jgi:hypothetical protein
MAYLVHTDTENLRASLSCRRIRVPKTQSRTCDLGRLVRGDRVFLFDYQTGLLHGPLVVRSDRAREEKNPRTGPFNGRRGRGHFLYLSIEVDDGEALPRGAPAGKARLDEASSAFSLSKEEELRILDALSYRNSSYTPLALTFERTGKLLRATVVESAGKMRIRSGAVALPDSLLEIIEENRLRLEDLLLSGGGDRFAGLLRDMGELVYSRIFEPLGLELLFGDGFYDIHIHGDARTLAIPLELAWKGRFIWENSLITLRGRGEREGASRRPARALVLADPSRCYERAYREGIALERMFRGAGLEVDFLSRPVRRALLNDYLRGCDLLHFAGHAGDGAWDIGGEFFQPDHLLGESVPSLVFSSCCGDTLDMGFRFLERGVSNVVATRWSLPDTDILEFLMDFYTRLFRGERIGYALNRAQLPFGPASGAAGPPFLFILQGDSGVIYETGHS